METATAQASYPYLTFGPPRTPPAEAETVTLQNATATYGAAQEATASLGSLAMMS